MSVLTAVYENLSFEALAMKRSLAGDNLDGKDENMMKNVNIAHNIRTHFPPLIAPVLPPLST